MKIKMAIAAAMFLCSAGAMRAQTAPASTTKPNEVNARMENQRDRIKQGVKSGELTKSEQRNLNKDQKAIHEQVDHDRAMNGGKLTKAEHKQVNREMNAESKKIYRDKHNGAKRKKG